MTRGSPVVSRLCKPFRFRGFQPFRVIFDCLLAPVLPPVRPVALLQFASPLRTFWNNFASRSRIASCTSGKSLNSPYSFPQ